MALGLTLFLFCGLRLGWSPAAASAARDDGSASISMMHDGFHACDGRLADSGAGAGSGARVGGWCTCFIAKLKLNIVCNAQAQGPYHPCPSSLKCTPSATHLLEVEFRNIGAHGCPARGRGRGISIWK
eukprot:scaffold6283_cov127-Isochrysis_galbana.AAC.2